MSFYDRKTRTAVQTRKIHLPPARLELLSTGKTPPTPTPNYTHRRIQIVHQYAYETNNYHFPSIRNFSPLQFVENWPLRNSEYLKSPEHERNVFAISHNFVHVFIFLRGVLITFQNTVEVMIRSRFDFQPRINSITKTGIEMSTSETLDSYSNMYIHANDANNSCVGVNYRPGKMGLVLV